MKSKFLLLFVSIAVILSSLMIGFSCKPSGTQQVFEISLGNVHPPEAPENQVYSAWINWVEKESGGRIKIKFLPAGQSGVAFPDYYDAVKNGILDMADCPAGVEPGRFLPFQVTQLPFLWPGGLINRTASMTTMALYDKYPEFHDQFNDVKILTFHYSGAGQIATVSKQIKNTGDVKGLVIDAVYGKWDSKALQAAGATPESMMVTEIYDALAKKVIDGVTISWTGFNIFGLADVCNYVSETNICQGGYIIAMNLNKWNSLPRDLQKLFEGDNALLMSGAFSYLQDTGEIDHKARIESEFAKRGLPKIYSLPDDIRAQWVQSVKPVWEEWVKEAAGVVGEAKARSLLEDTIKFAQQYRYDTYPDKEKERDKGTLHKYGVSGY